MRVRDKGTDQSKGVLGKDLPPDPLKGDTALMALCADLGHTVWLSCHSDSKKPAQRRGDSHLPSALAAEPKG